MFAGNDTRYVIAGCRAVRRKQVRRIQVRRMQFRRMDTSPYGQFAVRTIRRTDNSP